MSLHCGNNGWLVARTRMSMWWCWSGCVALGVLSSCASDDARPGAPAEPTVESRPGIVQVNDIDGPVLNETETCRQFRAALVSNAQRLGCATTPLLACPTLVQPLASAQCIVYSELSVERCVAQFGAATDCRELIPGACVLTAHLDGISPECEGDDAAPDTSSPSTSSAASSSGVATASGANSDSSGDAENASSGDAGFADGGSTDGSAEPFTDAGEVLGDASLLE